MQRIVGIIQARMGSRRFPGKIAADLCGYPVIDWVVRRAKQSELIDVLVLATSTNAQDDYVVEKAEEHSINCYLGSEEDVLSRFVQVTKEEDASIVVRICSDNPLICGSEIDRVIELFERKKPDYVFNHIPAMGNNYVDGIGAEVLSFQVLMEINELATESNYREHVTKYIWDNIPDFSIATVSAPKGLDYPDVRLDVDTHDDLAFLTNSIMVIEPFDLPEDVDVAKLLENIVAKA